MASTKTDDNPCGGGKRGTNHSQANIFVLMVREFFVFFSPENIKSNTQKLHNG